MTTPSTATSAHAATLAQIPYVNATRWGSRPALRSKVGGSWQDTSYLEHRDIVDEFARGLIALGVQPGDRVSILSNTRAEWAQAAAGAYAAGAAVVPIYPSSSPDECAWVLGDSGSVVVVCEDEAQAAKIDKVRSVLPDLEAIVVISGSTDRPTMAQIRDLGAHIAPDVVQDRVAAVRPEDLAIIIYTSGTTGRPKGCMLTHRNLDATNQATRAIGLFDEGMVTYLYLPMAHIFGQCSALLTAEVGGVVAFVSGGTERIVPDLAEVRPEYLPSVPRIFEKLYTAVTSRVPADVLQRGLAARAELRSAPTGVEPDAATAAAAAAIDPVLTAARGALGGNVKVAISGAAPISADILRFFVAAGVPVLEGYGLSESGGIGTLNLPGKTAFGTVGAALPELEVRLADDGEILLAGGHIFAGYWGNREATDEILVDGWLHTGDLGTIDADGMVTITGRKKEIIITAGGKNITPANIENDLRQHPFISQALMHGDRRPYPSALITLDPEVVLPWARENGLPDDLTALAEEPMLRAIVAEAIDKANSKYATVAQIKKFTVLPHDFTQEDGELTPTLKMKRAVINARYAEQLDLLYEDSRTRASS